MFITDDWRKRRVTFWAIAENADVETVWLCS